MNGSSGHGWESRRGWGPTRSGKQSTPSKYYRDALALDIFTIITSLDKVLWVLTHLRVNVHLQVVPAVIALPTIGPRRRARVGYIDYLHLRYRL